jgi:hypothetical protein
VIGALIIQTLTSTIYAIGVPPEINLVVKAVVVFVVMLLQSPSSVPPAACAGVVRPTPGPRDERTDGAGPHSGVVPACCRCSAIVAFGSADTAHAYRGFFSAPRCS